jgi:hypothetical protein
MSQGTASIDHPHVRVFNIQDIDLPMQMSAAAAAAAAAAQADDTSSLFPPPPGFVDIARGGGGLPRHVLAAVAGAQVLLMNAI